MFSLKKVTFVVVSSLVAASFVSANEPAKISTDLVNKAKDELTQLISKFDTDNNGVLSKAEVAVSKHEVLLSNFNAIDTNSDSGLSEEELKSFNLIKKQ